MEVCHNCKNKPVEFKCDICKRAYCQQCDSYIHSFSSKNKYTTDKYGFYVYTGNNNMNYSFYKNKKNPLFEETKEENNNKNKIINKIQKENIAEKSNRALSPERMNCPKKTYNLESDEENSNKLPISQNALSSLNTLDETALSIRRNKSFNSCCSKTNIITR